MEEKKPLVSIIVRTKDRPELLKTALKSISAQTYRPIEVVLVNDGGCDLNADELKGILEDVSLNYNRLEKNTGRANAANIGIENTKGKYVGFLDDDDEFYPEHVSVLVSCLEQSDLKIAYTDSLMVYKECNPQLPEKSNLKKELVYSEEFDYDTLIFENYIPFICLLFDREVLINSGRLDSRFEVYEDYDLLIRLGEKYPFHHIRKTTADYNLWHSVSQISQGNKDIDFLRESYLRLFSKHIDKFIPERIYNYRAKKYAAITDKDTHIRDKDARIENLETFIRNLQDVIKGKDQYITSVICQLKQREEYIANLRDKEAVLNNIYNSRGWKTLLIYYRIRDKILPVNSVRRRFTKSIFKFLLLLPGYFKKKQKNQLREG